MKRCTTIKRAQTPSRIAPRRFRGRRIGCSRGWSLILLSVGCIPAPWAYGEPTRSELVRLQMELVGVRQAWQRSARTYEMRIADLEHRLAVMEPGAAYVAHAANSERDADGERVNVRLSTMIAAGGSDQGDDELQLLQAGSHDPNRNGFTMQLIGLALQAPVGNYAVGRASITSRIDPEGENKVELEEAYLQGALPNSAFEFRAGQYFTEFGYLNPRHAHDWAFIDKPVILSRLFGGDALRNPGVQIARGSASEGGARMSVGVQHPSGETARSFLFKGGEDIGGHLLIDREVEDFGDLLYSARLAYGWDSGNGVRWRAGASGLWGPNATASDARTAIYGFDFGGSWSGSGSGGGQSVDWNTELLWRRYEAGTATASEVLRDWGGYTQIVWLFRPDWLAGVRLEYADGNGDNHQDPFRDRRTRTSWQLGWLGWRNASLRLQYNHDRADHLDDGDANSVWVQLRYALGGDEHHTH